MVITSKLATPTTNTKFIGPSWLFIEDGTFVVPFTGTYQIELHGGGGGGGGGTYYYNSSYGFDTYVSGGCGGGSGELYTLELVSNESYTVRIGEGGRAGYDEASVDSGSAGSKGSTTWFGTYSVDGGEGGTRGYRFGGTDYYGTGGIKSGSIATDGTNSTPGYGNSNNIEQSYGNGGARKKDGEPGAVIVTFMGVNT